MQFIVIASLIASVLAVPAEMAPRSYYGHVCAEGLYSNAQCCTPDILGLACLDANVPSAEPRNRDHFRAICAETGKSAKCCVLPVLGQDLLCTDPV